MPSARSLAMVWMIALGLTSAVIWLLPRLPSVNFQFLPPDKAHPLKADLFLGSSLTRHLLPSETDLPEVLTSGRNTLVLSAPGATADETLEMLDWAITNVSGDIALEVNAFTVQYEHLSFASLPLIGPFVESLPRLRADLSLLWQRLFGKQINNNLSWARLSRKTNKNFASSRFTYTLAYTPISFQHETELKEKVRELSDMNRDLILYWPPVPQSGAGRNIAKWNQAKRHINEFCKQLAVRCWLPDKPWSDAFFVDSWGHLAPTGQAKFASTFRTWKEAKE